MIFIKSACYMQYLVEGKSYAFSFNLFFNPNRYFLRLQEKRLWSNKVCFVKSKLRDRPGSPVWGKAFMKSVRI